MKNIVLLTSDLCIEYCLTVLQGITTFLERTNDMHLIVARIKSKNDKHGTFVYQYSSNLELVTAKDVDGYIVLSTTFGDFLPELISSIREKTNAPIVSLGVPLDFENCYSTVCNTNEIYKEIVGHLVKEHNCKKIGFFSANETNSSEALQRFESYKLALKEYDLEYSEDFVLHGNFTRYRSKQVIAQKFKTKEDIPFDSIICANDLTASGCIEAFSAMGVSIPDELKIIGFDDVSQASLSEPSISTVNQQIAEQGLIAAGLIYRKISGLEIKKITEVFLSPVYRQSCGCINLEDKDYVYKTRNGKVVKQNENYREFIKNYYDKLSDSRNIYVIFDFIHSNGNFETLTHDIDSILNYTGFKGVSIGVYENPINLQMDEDFILPEKVYTSLLYDRPNNIKTTKTQNFYNPNERLIPKEFDDIPGFFILQPIYNCSLNYGYMLCRFTEQKMEIYSIHLKIINQAVSQAVEFSRTMEINHRLMMEKEDLVRSNTDLSKQSKTDELTQILNRRGFMEYGQQQINLSISMSTSGSIFFADLDGLKKINDGYGHKMGDLAIQLAAKALKSSFRKADIAGRLSGDEFAVVATDMSLELLERTRAKLDKSCKELQQENNLPFTLSMSLGAVEYNESSYYLKELLIKADESLYQEKEKHHERLRSLGN